MDENTRKNLRDYAWSYFSLHSEQRLKTFHFFIILSTILIGGILTVAKEFEQLHLISPIAFLLSFLAFVFWKLDDRNKELIKHAEEALKSLEIEGDSTRSPDTEYKPIQLFLSEDQKTSQKKRFPQSPLLSAHVSFTGSFRAVFFVYGFIGVVVGIFCLFK